MNPQETFHWYLVPSFSKVLENQHVTPTERQLQMDQNITSCKGAPEHSIKSKDQCNPKANTELQFARLPEAEKGCCSNFQVECL